MLIINATHTMAQQQSNGDVELAVREPVKNVDAGDVQPAAADKPAAHVHHDDHTHDLGGLRWLVLFVSAMGGFLASVSTSALVIAFPEIIKQLHVPIDTMMWILLVTLLMICCVVPIAGKLGDMFGQAPLYKFGYGVFVLASLGAGFANKDNNGKDLLGARVVAGFGATFLFCNSSAILTDAFAPYNQVGLAQGVFQLVLALGTVLGPLIGGAFSESDWRWIFWFNVPIGGVCWLIGLYAVRNTRKPVSRTWAEHWHRFDKIGAIFCMLGLVLLLLAMIQAVSPDPTLSQPGPLAGLIVGGLVCGAIFIVDQFYAIDPLIPPTIFKNTTFTVSTVAGTLMGFARNSISYNMIFFLQGPHGMDPLQAGIQLIPFGIGVMIAGFLAGGLADKVGVRAMAVAGPIICAAGCLGLAFMRKDQPVADVGGTLFVTGLGAGLFNSPNAMAGMLSVKPSQRGVAASVSMLTSLFTAMVGIVITFAFVLNSMDQTALFTLFIYGGQYLPDQAVQDCIHAIQKDWWIVVAALLACSAVASQLSHVSVVPKPAAHTAPAGPYGTPNPYAKAEGEPTPAVDTSSTGSTNTTPDDDEATKVEMAAVPPLRGEGHEQSHQAEAPPAQPQASQ